MNASKIVGPALLAALIAGCVAEPVMASDGTESASGALVVLALILIVCAIQGAVGWLIAKGKGRGTAGFWWGALLGWIGWIIAALIEPSPQIKVQRMAQEMALMKAAMKD